MLIDGDLTNVGMWHCIESCDLNVLDMDFRLPVPLRGDRILFGFDVDVPVFVFVTVFVEMLLLLLLLL